MEIKLLEENYDKRKVYEDFVSGEISLKSEYVSEDFVIISSDKDFPIYLSREHNSLENFKEAIQTLKTDYIDTARDIHMNRRFWHSLFVLYKRDYIVQKYPEVLISQKNFENIVLKKFDWENYVYKCTLAAEYMQRAKFENKEQEEEFIKIIYNNLDIYNYIIKYNIFRNAEFILNFLTVINDEGLGDIMKKRIPYREDLGKDERYGRRVIFELNKKYPIVMVPFLDKNELKEEILDALALYEEKRGE